MNNKKITITIKAERMLKKSAMFNSYYYPCDYTLHYIIQFYRNDNISCIGIFDIDTYNAKLNINTLKKLCIDNALLCGLSCDINDINIIDKCNYMRI